MARLLVVDDEPDVLDLVVEWLQGEGHEVLAATDGAAALAAVDRHGLPQVAVLDLAMPGMDGIDLLRALRRRDPGLPALFLTAVWTGGNVDRMRDTGGAVMVKPSSSSAVCAQVRQLLPIPQDPAERGNSR